MIVLSLSTFPKHLNLHNIDKHKLSQPIRTELCMSPESSECLASYSSATNFTCSIGSFSLASNITLALVAYLGRCVQRFVDVCEAQNVYSIRRRWCDEQEYGTGLCFVVCRANLIMPQH